MPSKKKKYNARFPAGRIKKIMQSDEEIGKVAQAVPVIISRTLELFVESLLKKTTKITNARNARTLSPSHLKQCIISENKFDFLKDLVKNIPDISSIDEGTYDEGNGSMSSSDIPTTSASSSSVDHEANHQIIRHHLLRSQSTGIGFGSSQQQLQCLSTIQQRVPYPDSSNPLKHKLSSSERSSSVPTKLARLNSSPATSTITSNYLTKPQETVTSSTSSANVTPMTPTLPPPPPAFKIEIKSPDTDGNHANNNSFPIQISYCIDANSTNNTTSTISSSTPPVSCPEPPVVKIDYSKINLPMTSASNEATSTVAPIKIDYTNYNHQSAPSYSSLPQSQVQELDEDYDNL